MNSDNQVKGVIFNAVRVERTEANKAIVTDQEKEVATLAYEDGDWKTYPDYQVISAGLLRKIHVPVPLTGDVVEAIAEFVHAEKAYCLREGPPDRSVNGFISVYTALKDSKLVKKLRLLRFREVEND